MYVDSIYLYGMQESLQIHYVYVCKNDLSKNGNVFTFRSRVFMDSNHTHTHTHIYIWAIFSVICFCTLQWSWSQVTNNERGRIYLLKEHSYCPSECFISYFLRYDTKTFIHKIHLLKHTVVSKILYTYFFNIKYIWNI